MGSAMMIFLLVVGLTSLVAVGLAVYLGIKVLLLALRLIGSVIGGVFRAIGNVFSWLFGLGRRSLRSHVHCSRPACGEANPTSARFCRRCGRALKTEVVSNSATAPVVPPPIPTSLGSR